MSNYNGGKRGGTGKVACEKDVKLVMKLVNKYIVGFNRYEKLRKLSPKDFGVLYNRSLRGDDFDDLVDKL